jgi:hypothetical protein
MLIDLRNRKEADSYLLFEWRVWSVVWINNFSDTCVSILHISALGQSRIQQCHCLIDPPAHTSCRQPSPVGLSHHCLMQCSGSQYLHKSCSFSPVAL